MIGDGVSEWLRLGLVAHRDYEGYGVCFKGGFSSVITRCISANKKCLGKSHVKKAMG